MIIAFETQRQGLIIHFGKAKYRHLFIYKDKVNRRVDLLIKQGIFRKPRLVAICFNNWRSNLPFSDDDAHSLKESLAKPVNKSGAYGIFFPGIDKYTERQALTAFDGLDIIFANPSGEAIVKDAPVILGFVIDRKKLEIDWYLREIKVHHGNDTLHGGVSVTEHYNFRSSEEIEIQLIAKSNDMI